MISKNSKGSIPKFLKFRLGLKYRIKIYEKLEAYTKEGFPVYDSLLKFKQRYDKKKDFRSKVMVHWLDKMKNGANFSQAIRGWVPDAELNLISAGEDGTGLEHGLKEAIKFGESSQKIKSTIIGGSMYPLILLIIILLFTAMFSVQMAPTYLNILPLERWPDIGQTFYGISKFVVDFWMILLGSFAVIGFVISKTIGNWTGAAREFADKFPPWSIYKVYQSCSFLIALSSMMQSEIPLNESLIKLRKTSSPWLAKYIDEMMRNLRRGGENFGKHLNVGLLDEETAWDVIDYSELGNFEEAVYAIGEKNLKESIVQIEARMSLVKNLMIVLVGLTVGMIYMTNVELNSVIADSASSSRK